MSEIKICIFEDNNVVRDALQAVVNSTPGMKCTGAYADAAHLDEAILQSNPDVVLMDIEMPGIKGIEATAYIHDKYPDIKILIQTVFDDSTKIFKALCAGANGYILKIDPAEKQLEAIFEVYNGGAPMSPGIAKKVIDFFGRKNIILTEPEESEYDLSPREKEILQMMARGQDFRNIGEVLKISYETVRTHVKRIYRKLHVSSRVEAIMKANQQNLL